MIDERIAPPLYSVRVGGLRGLKHRFPGGSYVTRGFDLALDAAEANDGPATVVEVNGTAEIPVWRNSAWLMRAREA